jgi:hybrid cluster-associated redox disulfide protein
MPLKRFYNPDLPLSELMVDWPEMIEVFFRHQLLCVGCHVAPFHTLSDACLGYGLNVNAFYAVLPATLRWPPAARSLSPAYADRRQ